MYNLMVTEVSVPVSSFWAASLCVCVYVCMCVHIYIYIYIHIHTYTYVYIYNTYVFVYIYIYIERERERDRLSVRVARDASSSTVGASGLFAQNIIAIGESFPCPAGVTPATLTKNFFWTTLPPPTPVAQSTCKR